MLSTGVSRRAARQPPSVEPSTWGKALDCSKEIRGMNHAALLRTLARRAPLLQSLTRRQFVHWPRIATKQHEPSLRLSSSIRTMASIHIDDKVKALINNSYPQAQDAGDDPHKLSTIAFPHVEVSTVKKPSNDPINQLTPNTVLPAREGRDRAMAHHLLPRRLCHRGPSKDR